MSRLFNAKLNNFTKTSVSLAYFYALTRPFDFEIYTGLVDAHERGGPVWRPAFFDFTNESQYY